MRAMYGASLLLAVIFLFFSCGASADIIGTADEEVQEIAEPILENILRGFIDDDYEMYARDFDPTLRESITPRHFMNIDRQLQTGIGNYIDRHYLGFLTRGRMTIVLWRGRFDNTDDDVLIKLVLSKRGPDIFVTGLWFE
jgi:hypothetical protein